MMASVSSDIAIPCLLMAAMLLGGAYHWYFVSRRKARRQIKALWTGLHRYVKQYDRIPIIDPSSDEQPASRIIDVLRAEASAWDDQNLIKELNPEGIDFVPELKDKHGAYALCDPWGERYHIALDLDGDEI